MGFYRPRQLSFLEGSKGTFIYGESYPMLIHGSFTNFHLALKHPYAALGVVFVKNITNLNINQTINFVGSAGEDEKAGLFIGTPDNINANKSRISRITWQNIHNQTSKSNEFAASGNVGIPAGKTVAILLYTSSNLHSGDITIGEPPEFFFGKLYI